jgi:hypothetical protein
VKPEPENAEMVPEKVLSRFFAIVFILLLLFFSLKAFKYINDIKTVCLNFPEFGRLRACKWIS